MDDQTRPTDPLSRSYPPPGGRDPYGPRDEGESTGRVRSLLARPPVSAAIGGLVVGLVFLAAIAAGLIEGGSGSEPVAGPALADPGAPLAGEDEEGSGAPSVQRIYEGVGPGVVFIEATAIGTSSTPFDIFPNRSRERATGSGFVIDREGRVLTNAHVVDGAERVRVRFDEDTTVDGEVVGQDTSSDLALLRVDVDEGLLRPLQLADSSQVNVGDPVVAIGNPFGLDRTVTSGIVSALQRQIQAPDGFTISDVIQTDASINPGNSGGPLLDARGRVIGVNSQIATTGGGSVGIAFAVPSNKAREVVESLDEEGEVSHAYLGISGVGIDEELAETFNLSRSEGVLVQTVVDGGPADKAGMRGGQTQVTVDGRNVLIGGDIITAIDGEEITDMEQVVAAVESKEPGDEIEITVVRGASENTVTATLEDRPDSAIDPGGGLGPGPGPGPDPSFPFDDE